MRFSLVAGVIAMLLSSALPAAETTIYYLQTDGRGGGTMWKVSSSGSIEHFEPALDADWNSGYFDDPHLVSPDGRRLVYRKNGDLWIHDLATSEDRQATTVAKPYDGHFSALGAQFVAWSPHGDRFLYEVTDPAHFPPAGCADEPPPAVRREFAYGYYVYDLHDRSTHFTKLPGRIMLWLSDEEVVVSSGTPVRWTPPYFRMGLGGDNPRLLPFPSNLDCGQPAADATGSRLLVDCTSGIKTSEIVELDLGDGSICSVSEVGEFAEFQWPSYSPSGREVAWVQELRTGGIWTETRILVDSKPVFGCEQLAVSFRWIDDDTILAICRHGLTVLDLRTGDVKGQALY